MPWLLLHAFTLFVCQPYCLLGCAQACKKASSQSEVEKLPQKHAKTLKNGHNTSNATPRTTFRLGAFFLLCQGTVCMQGMQML